MGLSRNFLHSGARRTINAAQLLRLIQQSAYYRCIASNVGSNHHPRIAHVLSTDGTISNKTAIVEEKSNQYTFDDLRVLSQCLAERISDASLPIDTKTDPVCGRTVAFLATSDAATVVSMFACWISGCTAVPLSAEHPSDQWEHVLRDSKASLLVNSKGRNRCMQALTGLCNDFGVPLCELDMGVNQGCHSQISVRNRKLSNNVGALLMYTSGTTGPPKGVLITHGILKAQMANGIEALGIDRNDTLLNPLNLDNSYGLISGLLCPLSVGATVHIWPNNFDAIGMWESLTSSKGCFNRANVFMGDPPIYRKLLEHYDVNYKEKTIVSEFIRATCKDKIRSMVSSSAPLLDETASRWTEATGHHLVECYGMTEIGLAIATPHNESVTPGFIGKPLPKVELCIAKPNKYVRLGYDVISNCSGIETPILTPKMEAECGEVYIRGPNVFHSYWNKPEETAIAFTLDGWFKTGDTAQYSNGSYRILGRTSFDIIKSGGFQISALDVEHHLLHHEDVAECVVFGLPDIVWGQKVAAVIVLNAKGSKNLTTQRLHEWCKTKIPPYCVPAVIRFVSAIPRNCFGRINRKSLIDIVN